MARRLEAEIYNIKTEWERRIMDPEFRDKSFKDQGEDLGVSGQTISNWRKEINSERWQQILDMTVKESAAPTIGINDALRRKALSGDVPAIKLWHEIVRGWSPKQVNENINKNEVDALSKEELEKRAQEILNRRIKPEVVDTGKVENG